MTQSEGLAPVVACELTSAELRELKKGGVYMNMRWRPIRAAKK